jgi:outer membrane immunogenic protein
MKRFLFGSMALVALGMSAPAVAADMPVKALPPPPVVYDWSGVYVGFNIGAVWHDIDRVFPGAPGSNFSTSSDGDGIYGFHAGAQGQWGSWVLGIEAAYSGCFRECRSLTGLLPAPPFAANRFGEHKLTNLFTIGPRLGFAWDRWMIYGTGGAAAATLKAQYCVASTGLCGLSASNQNGDSVNWGWFAGGGFEYMVHKGALVDVILGAEYQHFDVREKTAFCFNAGCGVAVPGFDYNLSATGDIVRARLTIKTQGWGWAGPWDGPVAAKY